MITGPRSFTPAHNQPHVFSIKSRRNSLAPPCCTRYDTCFCPRQGFVLCPRPSNPLERLSLFPLEIVGKNYFMHSRSARKPGHQEMQDGRKMRREEHNKTLVVPYTHAYHMQIMHNTQLPLLRSSRKGSLPPTLSGLPRGPCSVYSHSGDGWLYARIKSTYLCSRLDPSRSGCFLQANIVFFFGADFIFLGTPPPKEKQILRTQTPKKVIRGTTGSSTKQTSAPGAPPAVTHIFWGVRLEQGGVAVTVETQ